MRDPLALRRLRAGALDRRIAAAACSLAGVALLCTAGVAHGPVPPPRIGENDAGAARELVALARAGERASWSAAYDFVRTLASGRTMRQAMREARNDTLHVLLSGSSMTIESRNRAYDCTLVRNRSGCTASATGAVLPESEVLRVAVAAGAYGVTRGASETIAGERARCFRVLATGHGGLPDIGVETDLCLAADGVPLRERVVRATGDVDQRIARSVSRRVTTASIEALARSFDPETARRRR